MHAVEDSDCQEYRLTDDEVSTLRAEGMECHLDSLVHFRLDRNSELVIYNVHSIYSTCRCHTPCRQVCRVNAQCLGMKAALFSRQGQGTPPIERTLTGTCFGSFSLILEAHTASFGDERRGPPSSPTPASPTAIRWRMGSCWSCGAYADWNARSC